MDVLLKKKLLVRLRKVMLVALPLLLGVMLIVTIYFTLFDLEWLGFLAGVLFAAVSSMASHTTKSHWLLLRRTKQLEISKELLADERLRHERAVKALEAADLRFQVVNDAQSTLILFVDREEHCVYHNAAFAQWTGRSAELKDGAPLHAFVSDEIYRDLRRNAEGPLAGSVLRYDAVWPMRRGSKQNVSVTLVPFPPEVKRPSGFYALISLAAEAVVPAALPVAAQESRVPPPVAAVRPAASYGDVTILSQNSDDTVFLEAMTSRIASDGDPGKELERALAQDEFILFAQKIRPLGSRVTPAQCFEVLLRLKQEEENMQMPGSFFPVAERYNLIGEIDRWVVRHLLAWHAGLPRATGGRDLPMYCVNLCGTTIADHMFATYVKRQLEATAVEGACLCIEIGAADLADQRRDLKVFMHVLRPLGCRFSLVGQGQAETDTFGLLQDFDFDFVKIDGMAIHSSVTSRATFAAARANIERCRARGARTIAEFVESEETLSMVREMGVDYAQGFGIGRPGPIARICDERQAINNPDPRIAIRT